MRAGGDEQATPYNQGKSQRTSTQVRATLG